MKLVSRFKDYYDPLRASDREPEPVYVRETKVFALQAMTEDQRFQADRLRLSMLPRLTWDDDCEPCVVAFCGRLFPLMILGRSVAYNQQQLVDAADKLAGFDDWTRTARGRVVRHTDAFAREWGYLPRRLDDDGPFVTFRAPVLFLRTSELVTNPVLRPLQFQSQVDAYTAWQELSMFLGNNMVSALAAPPRPITDEERAETKGFDRKTSFRNQKNRKKSDRGDW